ncbi:MAG TPA: TonB-dependent receptor [Chthoniobacterales bacterium]|nr:TonB-dependent receptor [Chthoniobacterales bacterium]
MTRNVQKTLGIRVALVAAAFPLIIAMSARAQDATAPAPATTTGSNIAPNAAPAATEATAERVVVTGSNIPTAEEVGPNPVDTYRRDDITRLGVRTATDLILRLPASTGSNTTENNTNGGDGSTRISLRGIDPKETLVLQDGRRLAYAGTASIDFNQFPLGLIDHIDILKDGASPIYGTEAVAGVVNVFLIKHFRGLEVYASYGNTNLGFAGDRGEETGYMLAGTGDDKTNIVVYAGIYNSSAIYSRDVNISHDPDKSAYGSFDVRSGNLAGRVTGAWFLGLAQQPFKLNLKTPTPHASANQFTDTQYTAPGLTPTSAITSERFLFNFADLTPDIAATDREYLYGSFDRDLCDKYLTVMADFKYFRQFWDGGLAPTPFTPDIWTDTGGFAPSFISAANPLGTVGAHPFGISSAGISVPTQNAFNPFTTGDYTSNGGFNGTFPVFSIPSAAPPGTVFTTGVRYRSLEAGLRTVKIQTANYVFTGVLKGNLGEFSNAWDQLKTWEWEFGFRYNESNRVANTGGIVNNNALRAFLLDTDPATAFNPFGKNVNNKRTINQVFTTTHDVEESTIMTEDFALRGDMFNLPGGAVRFAIGGAHLGNTFHDQPDPLTVTGQTTGSTNGQATKGNRDTWSLYWEARVPVTGPTWNFPGAYSLELGYAERFESYSDFGQTERPKFDVRWQPIDQSLTLRAAYIEAFHAPTLFELFGGTTQTFPAVKDTCSTCGTEPQVEQHLQGNPNLKPEIAYEYTYGGVITPGKWWAPLSGLTVSADYIHIDIRGFTTTLDAQSLINATSSIAPDANGTQTLGVSQVQRAGGVGTPITLLLTPEQNLGLEVLSAWDFEVVEIFETSRLGHGDWGTFTATWNETYMADVDVALLPATKGVPASKRRTVVGKFGGGFQGTNGGGSFTHNRWYASLFYDGPSGSWMQGIDGGLVVHYIGQYWDDPSLQPHGHTFAGGNPANGPSANGKFPGSRKVREWVTLDLIINYTFNLPPPAAQSEVAGYSKDGGKNVKMSGKDKNVMPVSTAEYNPCGWRAWLNQTTLTFGIDNLFDSEPPFVAGAFENGYDESTTNAKGRLWYLGVKKRF